jgi:hypothetical protein
MNCVVIKIVYCLEIKNARGRRVLNWMEPKRTWRCNECQACINFYMSLLSNLYILLVTSLDLWNDFHKKLAGRKWLFPVVQLSQQRYSSSLYFGTAWFCYDVNKESTKMHEFAMTWTQNLLNFEKNSWIRLSTFINFSATRQ